MISRDIHRPSALLLFLVFAIGVLAGAIGLRLESSAIGESARAAVARTTLGTEEQATVDLFEATSPSVVNIQTLTRQLVRTGRMMVTERDVASGGSGFIWDRDGHIVTNFHVIGEYSVRRGRVLVDLADTIQVSLSDGSVREAQVVGRYIDRDLAVLRIDPDGLDLEPIAVGDSQSLKVGQDVFAIGNPFGLDSTLTKGIISALGRDIEAVSGVKIYDVIQCDAAINPGNSGGPLMDSSGRLIGVNTQIKSSTRSSAGIGFAIPADVLSVVVPQLIEFGEVRWPTLGINIIPDEVARRNGVRRGVIVQSVYPGTGAAQAGIDGLAEVEEGQFELRDIILAIDNKPVTGVAELQRLLRDYRDGDRVVLRVARFGRERDVTVELGAEPVE